jgi:hypothetical protein
MDVLKTKAKLKALRWILLKYGKIEDIKLKRLTSCFYLILSIGMLYYQEECNISELTKVKVLICWPNWDLALRALECANKPSQPNLSHFISLVKC